MSDQMDVISVNGGQHGEHVVNERREGEVAREVDDG
jgi:hypothetical protein